MNCCQGKCCAVFTYPSTPEVLRDRGGEENTYIADMLIPLSPEEAHERCERLDVPLAKADIPLYTCRHWDEETKLCGAYEQRPMMCRDYPYDRPCEHGCDFRPSMNIRTKWSAIKVRGVVERNERV